MGSKAAVALEGTNETGTSTDVASQKPGTPPPLPSSREAYHKSVAVAALAPLNTAELAYNGLNSLKDSEYKVAQAVYGLAEGTGILSILKLGGNVTNAFFQAITTGKIDDQYKDAIFGVLNEAYKQITIDNAIGVLKGLFDIDIIESGLGMIKKAIETGDLKTLGLGFAFLVGGGISLGFTISSFGTGMLAKEALKKCFKEAFEGSLTKFVAELAEKGIEKELQHLGEDSVNTALKEARDLAIKEFEAGTCKKTSKLVADTAERKITEAFEREGGIGDIIRENVTNCLKNPDEAKAIISKLKESGEIDEKTAKSFLDHVINGGRVDKELSEAITESYTAHLKKQTLDGLEGQIDSSIRKFCDTENIQNMTEEKLKSITQQIHSETSERLGKTIERKTTESVDEAVKASRQKQERREEEQSSQRSQSSEMKQQKPEAQKKLEVDELKLAQMFEVAFSSKLFQAITKNPIVISELGKHGWTKDHISNSFMNPGFNN